MIPWGGVNSCLGAAALYLLGRSSGRDVEVLKTISRVNQLKDLGRVESETPIKCEHSGIWGVIVEETDDRTSRVHVVGARGAAGFALTVRSEVFEESGHSLVRGTLDYLQGLKMLGVKRVERVVPTGMLLTVVGEAVKDDIGTVRIKKPERGPFYVSHKSLDQLISDLEK